MPKDKDSTNHPCHLLSLPSAKRFWCRHCMSVFDDAITRWRHSRSCRYGVVNNFMRRRELEAKALQNTVALSPVEARLGQSIQMSDLAGSGSQSGVPIQNDLEGHPDFQPANDAFTCFICHQQFGSMEAMRNHVKYPCSSSKIITSRVPHPKHSIPVFIDTLPSQPRPWQTGPSETQQVTLPPTPPSIVQAHHNETVDVAPTIQFQTPQSMTEQQIISGMSSSGEVAAAGKSVEGITPTSIYVNDQGETVIEVENLDLNTEGGELSLAHLLTQLSQQGIVFDKTRTGQLQARQETPATANTSSHLYTTEPTYEVSSISSNIAREEEEQPTAEDAANTLAQLAGFRGFRSNPTASTSYQVGSNAEMQQVSTQEQTTVCYTKPEPHENYAMDIQPHGSVQYEYKYSATPQQYIPAPQHPHQTTPVQSTIESTPQHFEEIKVENTIDAYYDVAYVATSEANVQPQIEVVNNGVGGPVTQGLEDIKPQDTVLLQQYNPSETSREHFVTSEGVTVVSTSKMDSSETAILVSHIDEQAESMKTSQREQSVVEFQMENLSSGQNLEQQPDASVGVQERGHEPGHVQEESCPQVVEEVKEKEEEKGEEFTIQTVTLQEIVESETSSSLPYPEQKASTSTSDVLPTICFSEPGNVTTPEQQAGETREVILQGSSTVEQGALETEGLTVPIEDIAGSVQLPSQGSNQPAAMYVVTSTGIQPVGIKMSDSSTG
ncbi:uncharacterized protein LOC101854252 [Aplysia californica]|uniref:Uncharacterized protein LOC101854252 n=1 Tax=Aplysia californica TaxID=6500 RepID=A0ABM0ZYS8_APLCA|nr:uncharacterized protein LOC101854252 [Aplysia californica]